MNFATSNIALSPYDHAEELRQLPALGIKGLEVAPSRVWKDTWRGLSASDVEAYRRTVEDAGLKIIGLHSLFFDHKDLGLFRNGELRARSLDFMEHLSALCRDLGGRTLIYGGGRWRKEHPVDEAFDEATDFMGELSHRIESHGTCYCFEPLGPSDTDFIHTVGDSVRIVEAVASPALRVQIDAKALVENDEAELSSFHTGAPYLVHYHANEPGLGVLGSSGLVDHGKLGACLKEIAYGGYVSIEQRMLNGDDPVSDLVASARYVQEHYV